MAISLEAALRFATINVRGLAARRRQYQLSRLFADNELDIIAVQETKVESQEQTDRMVQPFRALFNVCVSHAVGTSGGCCLFIRRSVGAVETAVGASAFGRFVFCDFSYSNVEWRVICAYAPNRERERKEFFESLSPYLECNRAIVFLGDFNCVCTLEDRSGQVRLHDQSAFYLNDIVGKNALEDVGYCASNGNVQFTHFQGYSHARLDRAYISLDLIHLCSQYAVQHVSFSDHAMVMFTLGNRGKAKKWNWSLWKLNSSLVKDEVFRAAVKESFRTLHESEQARWGVRWELLKEEVKMNAIERSTILNHQKTRKENELRRQLNVILIEESLKPGEFQQEIRNIKNQLEVIDAERYRGAVVRARSEKLWLSEMPNKRALGDEKRYAQRNEIKEICCHNTVTRDKKAIERAFVEHYRNLLGQSTQQGEGFDSEFLSLMPQLDEHIRDSLEAPISVQEIQIAIDDLSTGKTPGPDGLGAEFYKEFKTEAAYVLQKVLIEAYENNRLPPSFLRTHTVLIPKSDDPVKLLSVASYRPISLANVDYKIYMKVLTTRLQSVIQCLVGSHQTCGIKGRTIGTNVHVARSILECCDALDGRVAMLQLDLEKAFDRVSHQVLFSILEHVNVGSVIIKGVKMSYHGCSTCLVVNKSVSEKIDVRSSVRQGCPLSPLLFAIYLEPFCLRLISNHNIRGFKLHSSEVKVLSYADDIAVFCVDQDSLREVVNTASSYCAKSGSLINWGKCTGFWHGNWDTTPKVFVNVQWTTLPARYLGVPLEHYRDTEPYWNDEKERVRTKTENWKGRDLSMFARATVCNLFLTAKIWYVLQFLSMSRINVQRLHRVFAVFIWGSTWERSARTNLFRSVRCGGLGLSHLFIRQIVSRFMFLRDQEDIFLRTVIQTRLRNLLPEFVVSSSNVMCLSVRGYLREVVLSFQMLKVRFSLEYLGSVSRKKLYKDLVDVLLPIPLYRSLYPNSSGLDVLKRVKRMPVKPTVKSFFFRLHCGVLPVKTWLEEKGVFVPWSTNCLLCKKPETIEHVFIECWDAIFHWDILQRTLKKELPITAQGIRFLPVDNDGGVPYDMFMALSLHSIWKTRMGVRHADVNVRTVRENFVESVAYIREVYRALPEPPDWWHVLNDLVLLKRL